MSTPDMSSPSCETRAGLALQIPLNKSREERRETDPSKTREEAQETDEWIACSVNTHRGAQGGGVVLQRDHVVVCAMCHAMGQSLGWLLRSS